MGTIDSPNFDAEKSRLEIEKLKREIKWWLLGPLATLLVAGTAVVGTVIQMKNAQIQVKNDEIEKIRKADDIILENLRLKNELANQEAENLKAQKTRLEQDLEKLEQRHGIVSGRFEAMNKALLDYEKKLTDSIDDGDRIDGVEKIAAQIRKIIEQIPLERIIWRDEGLTDEKLESRLSGFDPLAKDRLKKLYLDYNQSLTRIPPLASFRYLEKLDLRATGIKDLAPLAEIPWLEELDLTRTEISDIQPLSALTALVELDLSDCEYVYDYGPLAGLKGLRRLDLDAANLSDQDIAMIGGLGKLEELHIQRIQNILDIAPLANLEKLRTLKLGGTRIRDISPLLEIPKLKTLYLPKAMQTDAIAQATIDALKARAGNRGIDVYYAN